MSKITEAGQSGYDRNNLSNDEETALETSINRAFEDLRSEDETPLHDLLRSNWSEIMFAAEVAKAQFDQDFDGLNPSPGFFGIDHIHAGYFGFNDWDNTPDGTGAGNVVNWLDADVTDNLSGNGGGRDDPVRIGENAVHIVTSIGSYSESPVATRVQMYKNDSPRSAFTLDPEFRNTDLRLKRLDAPIVLAEDDDLFARFCSGANGFEALYLQGVTFIPEKQSRTIDPSDMPGENVVETP